jgi:hypothetical protein
MSVFELFSNRAAAYGNALLNWQKDPAEEILSYAWSYRRSAISLVASLQQRDVVAIDNGALPILFLYRHSFELYLKALVYHAALLSVDKSELIDALPRLWREHSLLRLVKMSLPVLTGSHPLTVAGELHNEVNALARKLDEVDSGSYSFRYPVSTKGEGSLPENFFMNIFTFSDAMERVLDDLSQFCHSLEKERNSTSDQMKLALHTAKDNTI